MYGAVSFTPRRDRVELGDQGGASDPIVAPLGVDADPRGRAASAVGLCQRVAVSEAARVRAIGRRRAHALGGRLVERVELRQPGVVEERVGEHRALVAFIAAGLDEDLGAALRGQRDLRAHEAAGRPGVKGRLAAHELALVSRQGLAEVGGDAVYEGPLSRRQGLP
jgi:hypothetical protein